MDIDISAKIISIRQELEIPADGFPDESTALDWYKTHYKKVKGASLRGSFGYRFGDTPDIIQFDYDYDPKNGKFSINFIPPIDKQVPLDTHAVSLAWESGIDPVNAPALRLAILVGHSRGSLPLIPSYVSADMGAARLLMHPPSVLSDEIRRRILDKSGSLSKGITHGYLGDRKRKNFAKYFDVWIAYGDWIAMKREKKREGKIISRKGYLKWIAKRLFEEYGWEFVPSSYTVCRYLARANNIWGGSL